MEKKASENKLDYKMLRLINYLYDYLFVFVINDMKLGDSSINFIANKIKIELKGKLPKDSISKNDLLSEYIFLGTYTNTAAPGGEITPWYFQKQTILKENLCSVLNNLNLLKK